MTDIRNIFRKRKSSGCAKGQNSHALSRADLKSSAGFAVAPILYVLGLVGVGAGVLFSGYSQILHSTQNVTNNSQVKNDEQSQARTMQANSVLGVNGSSQTILCPPAGAGESSYCSAASTPTYLTSIAAVTNTSALPKVAGGATVTSAWMASAGSPVEVGVFNASAGVNALDPWGHYYLVCRWENPTASGGSNAFIIISAGPDGTVQTNCGQTSAQSDDIITVMSVSTAQSGSNLWQQTGVGSSNSLAYGTVGSQLTVGQNGSLTLPVNSTLTVNGTTVFNGNVSATTFTGTVAAPTFSGNVTGGTVSGTSGTFSGAGSFNSITIGSTGQLTVSSGGNVSTSGTLTSGAATVSSLISSGSGSFGTTLGVTGNTLLGGTLSVLSGATSLSTMSTTGLATLNSATITNGATIGGTLGVTGNTSLSTMSTTGLASLSSLQVTGNATVGGTLGVTGTLSGSSASFSGTVSAANFSGSVSGGSISWGSSVVPIANGGTGSTSASAALAALGGTNASNLTTGTLNYQRMDTTNISNSGGPFNSVTVDQYGRVTAASFVTSTTSSITDGSGDSVAVGTSSGGLLTFTIGNTLWNVMDRYGNLGIGTTAPRASIDAGSRTDAIYLPVGSSNQRPASSYAGMLRYNSFLSQLEYYSGGTWNGVVAAGGGGGGIASGIYLGSSTSATNPQVSGDATTGLFSPAASTVAVSIAGTEKMRVNSTGLGIGTTSPAATLHLYPDFSVLKIGNASDTDVHINLQTATSAGGWDLRTQSSNGDFHIDEALIADRLHIQKTSGNVGIGTATVANKLDINGAASIGYVNTTAPTNGLIVNGFVGIGTPASYSPLTIQGNSTTTSGSYTAANFYGNQSVASTGNYYGLNVGPGFTATTGNTLNYLYGITSGPYNSSTGTITNLMGTYSAPNNVSSGTVGTMYGVYAIPENNAAGDAGGTVTTMVGVLGRPYNASRLSTSVTSMYGVQAQPTNNFTGTVATMYGLYSQCVNSGSGTVTTCYELYLDTPTNGGTLTNRYGLYQVDTASPNYFAGKVGIGSTAPVASLDLNQQTDALALPVGTTGQRPASPVNGMIRYNSYTTPPQIEAYANNAWTQIYTANNAQWLTNGTAIYYNAGNVGIGTNNPQNKLDVSGGVVIGTSYAGINTAPTNGMLVQGNVGIGTTIANAQIAASTPYSATNLLITDPAGNTKFSIATAGSSGNDYTTASFYNNNSVGNPAQIWQTGGIFNIAADTGGNGLALSGSNGTTHMVINASGKVGIGTTSPNGGSLLTIGSTAGTGGSILLNGATSGNATISVAAAAGTATFQLPTTNGSTGYVLQTDGTGVTSWTSTPSGLITTLGTSTSAANPRISGDATSGFYTAGTGLVDVTASGTKVVEWSSTKEAIPLTTAATSTTTGALTVAGGVGIAGSLYSGAVVSSAASGTAISGTNTGTSGTTYGLSGDTSANTTSGGYAVYANGNAAGYGVYSNAGKNYFNGNVGIGTATPQAALDVNPGSTGSIRVSRNGSQYIELSFAGTGNSINAYSTGGNPKAFVISTDNNSNGIGINPGLNQNFAVNTNTGGGNVTDLEVLASGNVGIGTTVPLSQLDVVSTGAPAASGNMNSGLMVSGAYGAGALNMGYYSTGNYSWINSGYNNNANTALPLVLQTQGGNVGIGTTNPGATLHVAGNVLVSDLTNANYVEVRNGTNWTGRLAASGTGQFSMQYYNGSAWTNGLTLNASGNVGIGTTSPGAPLHVYSTSLSEVRSEINSNAGNVARLALKGPTSNYAWFVADNANGLALYDYNASAYRMYVNSSGNVGIGTTNPSFGQLQVTSSSAVGNAPFVVIQNNSGANAGTFGPSLYLTNGVSGTNPFIVGERQSTSSEFYIANAVSPYTEYFVVSQAGNVGIGSTSPATLLDVNGNGTIRGNLTVTGTITGTTTTTFPLAATAGDTAAAPDYAWATHTNTGLYYNTGVGFTVGGTSVGTVTSTGLNSMAIGSTTPSTGAFTTLTTTGNVGIGTAVPEKTLDVNNAAFAIGHGAQGQIGAYDTTSGDYGLYIASNSGYGSINLINSVGGWAGTPIVINSSGNVGIGTTTPQSPLDVNGAIETRTGSIYMNSYYNAAWLTATTGYTGAINFNTGTGTMYFATSPSSTTAGAASTLQNNMVLTASGSVGIGTTSPYSGGLTVGAGGASSAGIVINGSASGTGGGSVLGIYNGGVVYGSFGNNSAIAGGAFDSQMTLSGYNGLKFSTLGTTQMVLTQSGNVGIGTTVPTNTLDISNTSSNFQERFRSSAGEGGIGADGNGFFRVVGTIGGAFGYGSASSNSFNEVMRLTNSGNVGIGTTSPQDTVHIYGTSDIPLYVQDAQSSATWMHAAEFFAANEAAGNNVVLGFGQSGTQYNAGYIGFNYQGNNSTSNYLTLGVWNNDHLLNITASGNVGIGTTSPTSQLQIGGTSSHYMVMNPSGSVYDLEDFYSTEANPRIQLGIDQIGSGLSALSFNYGPTAGSNTIAANGAAVGIAAAKTLGLYTSNGTALTERVRIDGSGNVGIGTTSPSDKLHIYSGGVRVDNGNSGYVDFWSGTGLFGGVGTVAGVTGSGSSNDIALYAATSRGIHFYSNGAENMTLLSGGNVGIGVTGPGTPLQVDGTTTTGGAGWTAFFTESPSAAGVALGSRGSSTATAVGTIQGMNSTVTAVTNLLINPFGGNVGIGSSSPATLLDVNGAATIRGNLTVTGTITGTSTSTLGATAAAPGPARSGESNTGLFSPASGAVAVSSLGSEMMRVNATGVGIGATSPGTALDVETTSQYGGIFVGNKTNVFASLIGTTAGNDNGLLKLISGGTQYVNLIASGNSWINGGNVGIGTTSPVYTLDVTGNANASNYWIAGNLTSSSGFVGITNTNGPNILFSGNTVGTNPNSLIFNTNNASRMIINSSGNVGIGTTSPGAPLHVYSSTEPQIRVDYPGTTQYSGAGVVLKDNVSTSNQQEVMITQSVNDVANTYSAFNIGQFNSSGSFVQSLAEYDENSNYWYFSTSGSPRLTISSGGNVGIGTTSPLVALDLGGANAGGNLHLSGNSTPNVTAQGAYISWNQMNGGYGETDIINSKGSGSGGIGFFNSTSLTNPLMLINAGGNVGIGTTSPVGMLTVNGVGQNVLSVGINSNIANSTAQIAGNLYTIATNASNSSQVGAVAYNFYNNGSSPSWAGAFLQYQGTSVAGNNYGVPAANAGQLVFQNVGNGVIASNGADIYISPNSAVAAVFKASGKVGIGTSAPQSLLHVQAGEVQVGTSGATCTSNIAGAIRYSAGLLYFCDSAGTWETIDSSGSAGSTGDYVSVTSTAPTPTGTDQGYLGATTALGAIVSGDGSTADVTLQNKSGGNALEVLTGTTNVYMPGNVGIGTTNPSYMLDVWTGNVYADGTASGTWSNVLGIKQGSNTNYMQVDTAGDTYFASNHSANFIIGSGNVGIGTTVPTQNLDVYGGGLVVRGARGVPASGNGVVVDFGGIGGANTGSIQGWDYGAATARNVVLQAAGGNVGIGTTWPVNTLTVVTGTGIGQLGATGCGNGYVGLTLGQSTTASGCTNYNILSSPTDQNLYINRPSGSAIYFRDNNNTQMVILDSGNVGIGTTNPTAVLHILDQNNAGWRFEEYNNGDGTNYRNYRARGTIAAPAAVQVGDRLASFLGAGYNGSSFNSPNGGISIWAAENYTSSSTGGTYMTFGTSAIGTNPAGGGTERMRIDSSGNVGIGTTGPIAKLDVQNTGAFGNDAIHISATGTSKYIFAQYDTTNDRGRIGAYDSSVSALKQLYFDSASAAFGGNVGIGNTSPNNTLDVNGNVGIALGQSLAYNMYYSSGWKYTSTGYGIAFSQVNGDMNFQFAPSGSAGAAATPVSRLYIQNGGNVGIGSTSPATLLDVNGAATIRGNLTVTGTLTATSNAIGARLETGVDGANNFWIGNNGGSEPNNLSYGYVTNGSGVVQALNLNTAGLTRLYVSSTGNVGIGTANPTVRLDVSGGNIRANGSNVLEAGPGDYGANSGQATVIGYNTSGNYGTIDAAIWGTGGKPLALQAQSGGAVGIGTTGPADQLTLWGGSSGLRNSAYPSVTEYPTSGTANQRAFRLQSGGGTFNIMGTDDSGNQQNYPLSINWGGTVSINNTSLNVLSSGNVGIGTALPVGKLQVAGGYAWINAGSGNTGARAQGLTVDSAVSGTYTNGSDPGDGLRTLSVITSATATAPTILTLRNVAASPFWDIVLDSNDSGKLKFSQAGSQPTLTMSGGNVGIGTTNPAAQLALYSASPTQNFLSSSTARTATIGLTDSYNLYLSGPTNGYTLINSGGSNVGIGTTVPLSILHVNGTVTVPWGFKFQNYNATFSASYQTMPFLTEGWDATQGDWLYLSSTGNGSNAIHPAMMSAGNQGIKFGYGTDAATGLTSEWMRINTSGNVGIGTTSPRAKLDITTTNIAAGTANDALVLGAGSITYPTAPYGGWGNIVVKGTTSDARLMVQDGNGRINNYWNAYTDASGYKYIVSNEPAGREQMTISGTTGGYFGWYSAPAGTAGSALSWTQQAEINGGTDIWFSPRGSNSDFYITNGGNVGIGTTGPGGPLDVVSSNTNFTNCGTESSSCPAPPGTGYGLILDSDYTSGQYRYRWLSTDRGGNLSLYLQEAQNTANSFSNVVRFGTNQYDANSFAVFGSTYLGGNVGIGTTVPLTGLSVYSGLNSGSNNYNYIDFGYSSIWGWAMGRNSTTGTFNLGYTSGSTTINNVLSATTGGNVGINQTNPGYRLQVDVGAAQGTNGIHLDGSDGHYMDIRPSMGAGNNNGIVQAGDTGIIYTNGTAGTGAFVIAPWYAGSGGLRMDSSGNTTITGNLTVTGTCTGCGGGGSVTYPLAATAGDTAAAPDYAWATHTNTGLYYNTGVGFTVGGTNVGTFSSSGLNVTNNITQGGSYLYQNGATGTVNGTGGPFLYGDTNNTVVKIGSGGGGLIVQNYSGTNEAFFATSGSSYINGGSVGIGTSSPQQLLDVRGNIGVQNSNGISFEGVLGSSNGPNQGIWWYDIGNTLWGRISRSSANGNLLIDPQSGSNVIIAGTNTANVGIGTASPAEKLDVENSGTHNGIKVGNSGGNYVEMFDDGNGHIEGTAGTNLWINGDNAATTNIGAAGGNTILNQSGGNVGIGNGSPGYPLDVTGDARAQGFIVGGNGGNYVAGSIYSDSNWGMLFRAAVPGNATSFAFHNSSDTELMRITNAGNVGIGNGSPTYLLDVQGTGSSVGHFMSSTSSLAYLDVQNNNTATGANGAIMRLITENAAGTGATTVDFVKYANGNFTINNNDTNAATFTAFGVSGSERMRINSSGYVGIGNTSPSYTLDVTGTARVSSNLMVGINGTSTGRQLTLAAWADASGSSNGTGLFAGNIYLNNNTNAFTYANTHASIGGIGFATNYPAWNQASVISSNTTSSTAGSTFSPLSIMTFNYNGNVGIGTTSPAQPLDVNGWAYVRGQELVGSNDGNSVVIMDGGTNYASIQSALFANTATKEPLVFNAWGGNVGIGNTSPSYTLDVTGNERVTGNLTVNANFLFTGNQLNVPVGNCCGELAFNYTGGPNVNFSIFNGSGTLTNRLYGAGGAWLNGAVTIAATTAATSTTTGALIVSGGEGVAGNLYVGGNLTVSGAFAPTNLAPTGQITPSTVSNTGGGSWVFGSSAQRGCCGAATGVNSVTGIGYTGGSGSQLFTFSSAPGQMSVQMDGSMFVGDNISYNPFSANGSYEGYLVVAQGASVGAGLQVKGASNHSSDGQAECCAAQYTLGISEMTSTTGHLPQLQFHAAGQAEAFFRLNGSRVFDIGDDQSVGSGIAIMNTAATVENVKIMGTGSSYFNGGSVGIGTTNPGSALDVRSGIIDFANSSGIGYGQLYNDSGLHLAADNTTSTGMFISAPAGFWFRNTAGGTTTTYLSTTAGSSYINATGGTVGIGTTTPSSYFQVNGGDGGMSDAGIVEFDDSIRRGVSIGYDTGTDMAWIYSRYPGCCGKWLNINNSIYSANGSNVGIKTSSPGYTLDVSGTFRATGGILTNNLAFGANLTSATAYWPYESISNNTNLRLVTTGGVYMHTGSYAGTTTQTFSVDGGGNAYAMNSMSVGASSSAERVMVSGAVGVTGGWNGSTTNGLYMFFSSNTGSIYSIQNGTSWRQLNIDGSLIEMTANSGGTVDIGNSGNSYKLNVNGDTYTNGWFRSNGNAGWYSQSYGGGWYMTDSAWIRAYGGKPVFMSNGYDSGGPSGVNCGGGLGNGYTFDVCGTLNATSTVTAPTYLISGASGSGNGMYAGNGDNANSTTNDLVLKSWWGIGFTSSCCGNAVNYPVYIDARAGNIGAYGSIYAAAYYLNSDATLKHDIQQAHKGLNVVDGLRTVTFKWNETNKEDYGVIAQEVQKVMPEVVGKKSDGKLVVQYDKLVLPVIEAVKELHKMIVDVEAKVASLLQWKSDTDKRLDAMEAEIKALKAANDNLAHQNDDLRKLVVGGQGGGQGGGAKK